jgi:AcrR family transcriptional regulator
MSHRDGASEHQESARDRIVAAASDLFLVEGILGSGIDRLIERSGVAKATFYRHFPSKDDVVAAWLRGSAARWKDSVLAQLDREQSSPIQRLLAFWEAIDDWDRPRGYPGCPYLNSLVELRDPDHPARREVASFIAEVDAFLSETVAEAGVPGPAEVGVQLRTLAMGMFMAMRLERSSEPAKRARAAAVSLLADRLGTTPVSLQAIAAERSF